MAATVNMARQQQQQEAAAAAEDTKGQVRG